MYCLFYVLITRNLSKGFLLCSSACLNVGFLSSCSSVCHRELGAVGVQWEAVAVQWEAVDVLWVSVVQLMVAQEPHSRTTNVGLWRQLLSFQRKFPGGARSKNFIKFNLCALIKTSLERFIVCKDDYHKR